MALGKAIKDLVRAQAKQRQAQAGPDKGKGKKKSACGKLPQAVKGKTRDKVASCVGMSERTFEKAEIVVDAAAANPALAPIVEEMDATGNVDRAFRKVQATKKPAPSPVAMKFPSGPIRGKLVAKTKQVPSGLHMQEGVYAFRAKVNASTFFGKSSVGLDIVATFLRQYPELTPLIHKLVARLNSRDGQKVRAILHTLACLNPANRLDLLNDLNRDLNQ